MKRLLQCLFLMSLLTLGGCIDIYQHVSQGTGGQTSVYLRLTIAKSIFEMAGRMSGGAETPDWEQMMSEMEAPAQQLLSDFGKVEMGRINTDLEFGMYYRASLNYRSKALVERWNSPDAVFVPLVQDGKVTIKTNFPANSDQTGNAMAAAFLSTAKYVITVDKRVCPLLKTATVQSGEAETTLEVVDLGDQYYCSVPIARLFNGNATIVLE